MSKAVGVVIIDFLDITRFLEDLKIRIQNYSSLCPVDFHLWLKMPALQYFILTIKNKFNFGSKNK